MRNKNIVLLALLCMGVMVTRVHAGAIVVYKDEEIQIYERRGYVPAVIGIGLSLVGFERARRYMFEVGKMRQRLVDFDRNSANFINLMSDIEEFTFRCSRIIVVSGSVMGVSFSSLVMKEILGWEGNLVLTLSPKGIHYIGSSLIPWESIREIRPTRYKTSFKNSFEFEIVTYDDLCVVIDSTRVDVEFNWLAEQINKFWSEPDIKIINIPEDASVQVGW